jgi:hypothetical protein
MAASHPLAAALFTQPAFLGTYCLPAAVLQVESEEVRQLCVRTCVARGADLGAATTASVGELARLAASEDPRDRRELLAVYEFLAAEYDYRPVDVAQLPYGDFAAGLARSGGGRPVVHSHGAIGCLERLLGLVREGGFILVNDYGQTEAVSADGFGSCGGCSRVRVVCGGGGNGTGRATSWAGGQRRRFAPRDAHRGDALPHRRVIPGGSSRGGGCSVTSSAFPWHAA